MGRHPPLPRESLIPDPAGGSLPSQLPGQGSPNSSVPGWVVKTQFTVPSKCPSSSGVAFLAASLLPGLKAGWKGGPVGCPIGEATLGRVSTTEVAAGGPQLPHTSRLWAKRSVGDTCVCFLFPADLQVGDHQFGHGWR